MRPYTRIPPTESIGSCESVRLAFIAAWRSRRTNQAVFLNINFWMNFRQFKGPEIPPGLHRCPHEGLTTLSIVYHIALFKSAKVFDLQIGG